MKTFDWRAGFRRAAIFIVLYIFIVYVMNLLFPETFGITREQLPGLLINAVFFFFILSVFFAWTEKRRRARMAEIQARRQGKQGEPAEEDGEPSPLKGQPNPNTSRKKARRRR
ncbi:MAG: hypothetical protein ACFB50_16955 [Rubrobacteraceae bacterium]